MVIIDVTMDTQLFFSFNNRLPWLLKSNHGNNMLVREWTISRHQYTSYTFNTMV